MLGSGIRSHRRRPGPVVYAGILAAALTVSHQASGQSRAEQGNDEVELSPINIQGAAVVTAWDPVEGYVADRASSATKTDVPLIETTQSISVISREQIEDRAANDLTEAVTYTPGINVNNGAERTVIDSFSIDIRGFDATNATYRDGTQLQAGLPYDAPLETYGLQRIEVLRGPASVLYGQAQPGGIINLVTKRPTEAPLREIGLEIGTNDHKQITADFGNSLDADGNWRYRLTGLWQDADSHKDFVNNDRIYLAPALTWAPSERTRLTFLSHYQRNETKYPWTAFPRFATRNSGPHGRVPDNRYIGEPGFDGYDSTEWAAGYIFSHRFNEHWKFRQNVRYRNLEYDVKDTFRDYASAYIDGPDDRTINRAQRIRYDDGETTTADNRLISNWQFGGMEHTVLVGVDYKTLTYESRDTGFFNPVSELDLYDPQYGNFTRPDFQFSPGRTEADQTGLYLQDRIKFGERWVVSLGGRHDWVEEQSLGEDKNDQDALTLRGGVVFLAGGGWAPYANYSESFTPQYGSNPLSGAQYDPITGEQYEMGLRYRPPGTGLSVTAAVFDIAKQNQLVQNPENPGNPQDQIQAGETRSRGAEFEVLADLTNNLKVTAAYTYQDVELVDNGADNSNEGNQLSGKPEHIAKLWLDYTVSAGPLDGLGLGSGVRYQGAAFGDSANTFRNPSSTLVDAAVRYALSKSVQVQVAANNLLDEQPVYCGDTRPTSTCSFGLPREVIGSIRYRWQ